ncbi:hypothetical protein LCGC14_0677340 [marine sediment metagenome]|uniref:Uncharacterized protein n=1 Tax=marine sediment metagenome TaxID=412755 RepID=A0A0F9QPB5_9ZZZZ
MNKQELVNKIREIEIKYKNDEEVSHLKVDALMYEYIGFTEKELKLVQDLCPWYA